MSGPLFTILNSRVGMIYTCTMNTAVDLFVETDELLPDVVNRTKDEDYQPNGKGVNISFMLKRLGLNNTALGFTGGFTGRFIENEPFPFG